MKKNLDVSELDNETFIFNATPAGSLPTVEVVEQTVSAITKKPIKEKVKSEKPVKWHKEESVGRVKLTTFIKKQLINDLKKKAIDRGGSLADLVELILIENYKKY